MTKEDRQHWFQLTELSPTPHQDSKVNKSTDHEEEAERSALTGPHQRSHQDTVRLQRAACSVSWVSIIFSLGTGLAGTILGISGRSESMFAYGMEGILDSLSSFVVVWRFHVSAYDVYSTERERKACIIIGSLFIVSALCLIAKDVRAIVNETHETKQVLLYATFAVSCGVITILIAAAKVYIGFKMSSQALYTDSIITLVGAATCFASVAGLELYVEDTRLWYLDSIFGILCGLFLLLFGIRLLYTNLREKT